MGDENSRVARTSGVRPYVLVLCAAAILQAYFAVLPYLDALEDWIAYVLVPLFLLGLLWVWLRFEGRQASDCGWVLYENPLRTLGLVALLVGAFLGVTLEAEVFIGLVRQPLPSLPVAIALVFAAPLVALSQVGIFQGYFLRQIADRGRLVRALGISSFAFALSTTNLSIVRNLSFAQAGDFLFLNAGTAFAISVVLGVFLYKSRWSLFGPASLQSALLLIPYLFPFASGSSSWELTFLEEVFALCAVLLLVVVLVREPSYLAHRYLGEEFGPKRYRFLRRAHSRAALRNTVVALAIVVVMTSAGILGLQYWSGNRTPLLAIATGSMAPTLVRGDLVLIEHVGPGQITVGTIIAYSGTCLPSPTVHRVISITTSSGGAVYTTKGDANPSPDACPVPYSEVLGKVVSIIPAVGYFVLDPALLVGVLAIGILIPAAVRKERPLTGVAAAV